MPGVNCSIVGCTVSRRSKYQGCGIYKIPSGEDEFETRWRNKLIAIITRDRAVDTDLRERINKKKLHICQRHFSSEQIITHESRTSLKPGELRTLNLPQKSIQSAIPEPRLSAARITLKKQTLPSSSIDVLASSCYHTYDEFRKRIQTLSLPSCWDICLHDNYTVLQCKDNIHSVPKFEIFADPSLSFTVKYFLWCLPGNHDICIKYDHSFKNVTVSNLIKDLNSYGVCCGITDNTSGYSFTEHSVPKQFSLTDATCKKFSTVSLQILS